MAPLTAYELQRQSRLAANRTRLSELGLLAAASPPSPPPAAAAASSLTSPSPPPPAAAAERRAPLPRTAARRSSSRLAGLQKDYSELSANAASTRQARPRLASSGEGRRQKLQPGECRPELYTREHQRLLGSAAHPWQLNKDGFAPDGQQPADCAVTTYNAGKTRVYDNLNGRTCHQCRQKTLGQRTTCSKCKSLRGQFCGDCLFMRYGENVLEAQANKDWVCPVCRDICNCSFCRSHKGWAPTGQLYRKVVAEGYTSVAHYLVLTQQEYRAEETISSESGVTQDETPEKSSSSSPDLADALLLRGEQSLSATGLWHVARGGPEGSHLQVHRLEPVAHPTASGAQQPLRARKVGPERGRMGVRLLAALLQLPRQVAAEALKVERLLV
eukprot:SM000127S26667  [mRNA]  locus=s127:311745:315728:- [translate_table: standard]